MTPLEEKLRRAIQAKAGQVPPEAVPPLRLSAHRRRSSSLAHGGGERSGASAMRGWLAPAASAAIVIALIAVSVVVSRSLSARQKPPPGRQHDQVAVPATDQAAAWVVAQVSGSDIVSCDPSACRALETAGFAPGGLLVLHHNATAAALSSSVIVETATVRADLGARFNARYAPVVLASFGSGAAQIEVRVVEAKGTDAYHRALATDLDARQMATTELLNSPKVIVAGAARRQLRAMRVDERLLIMISYLTTLNRVTVAAFGDSGPGAGANGPLRSAELSIERKSGRPATPAQLEEALTIIQQSLTPYRATIAKIIVLADGRDGLEVEYAAPTPLGIINYNG
ncbi:MAG TPA: hypothetical protein VMC03_11270 [Streptosporangiaceae bacterium]|nr:hypothetical protein [Streptosporangiaceae bacterium]